MFSAILHRSIFYDIVQAGTWISCTFTILSTFYDRCLLFLVWIACSAILNVIPILDQGLHYLMRLLSSSMRYFPKSPHSPAYVNDVRKHTGACSALRSVCINFYETFVIIACHSGQNDNFLTHKKIHKKFGAKINFHEF